jgi:hypothetical protein
MIHVMGHELLNGLAPIVSLAESGLAAWGQSEARRAQLMPEILATLARRAESLQRFTEAYRALARLPDPTIAAIEAQAFLGDMALLFTGHWQQRVALRIAPAGRHGFQRGPSPAHPGGLGITAKCGRGRSDRAGPVVGGIGHKPWRQ